MSDDLPTVFIVTSGEYSAYSIDSVWTSREAAEAHARGLDDGSVLVEEWVLNESTQRREVPQWQATLRAGDVIEVGDRALMTDRLDQTSVERHNGYWRGWGYGPSPERAAKALTDALAKAKAQEAGL